MIKEFKDTEMRDSVVLYKSAFEQVKMLHKQDPIKAGELAISAMELLLTGEMSTDDFMIPIILADLKIISERNREKYDKRVTTQKQKRVEDLKLDEIARLSCADVKQSEIGLQLGITQQVVSYRLGIIKAEYPELLTKYKNTKSTKNTNYDNDNVNDNVNEKENDNDNYCCGATIGELDFRPLSF